ncbi:MAG: MarR family transcriptional regulator [Gammaproteobacteria bacterium]|nr:MarR family transcriptional regulator [Gammaproteobacteria bacterium]
MLNRSALLHLYSRVPFLIHRTEQLVTAIQAAVSRSTITLGQCQLLAILAELDAVSQAQLAQLSGCDASTTSLILDNLAERGHIERRRDRTDRRRKLVAISAGGRRVLAAATPGLHEITRLLLEPLSREARTFVALLLRIAQAPQRDSGRIGASVLARRTGARQSLAGSPVFVIRRVLQVVDAVFSEELAGIDATIRQFAAMLLILGHPGICAADLARLGGFETSNVSFMLRLLCRKGCIERSLPSAGGRAGYRITAAGQAIVERAEPAMLRAERRLLEPLTASEADRLRQMLARILANAAGGRYSTMPRFAAIVADPQWLRAAKGRSRTPLAQLGTAYGRQPGEPGATGFAARRSRYARCTVAHLIVCSELRLRTALHRALARHGLGATEFVVVDALAAGRPIDLLALAAVLDTPEQALAGVVRGLKRKGLIIEHHVTEHGQRALLATTRAGLRTREAACRSLVQLERTTLNRLPARERADLSRALARLLDRLGPH